nr:hypothetical protein [Mycolicibacterium murale]
MGFHGGQQVGVDDVGGAVHDAPGDVFRDLPRQQQLGDPGQPGGQREADFHVVGRAAVAGVANQRDLCGGGFPGCFGVVDGPISMSLDARPWLVSLTNEISAAADFQAASVSSTVS